MTQVSRIPMSQETWNRVSSMFVETLTNIRDRRKLEAFIEDFFSPTERIMFSKRLACLVLLFKGHDYESIRKILGLSPPTIAKMSAQMKYAGDEIKPIIEDVLKRQNMRILVEEFKQILDVPTGKRVFNPERLRRKSRRQSSISQMKSAV